MKVSRVGVAIPCVQVAHGQSRVVSWNQVAHAMVRVGAALLLLHSRVLLSP